jgi:hypothetical protein
MNYKDKYEKYLKKNKQLLFLLDDNTNNIDNLNNQIGGENDTKKNYLKKLHAIKETMKKKGFVFWFDDTGKVLSQGLNTTEAKNKIINQIKENREEWKDKIVTELVLGFSPDDLMDEDLGGLQITVDLNKVIVGKERISIQMKNKTNSLFKMRYTYKELKNFKISDLKKISLFVSDEVLKKIGGAKLFHYSDMEEYL